MYIAFFWIFRLCQECIEFGLSRLNFVYFSNMQNLSEAESALGILPSEMRKALEYSSDRYRFESLSSWVQLGFFTLFCSLGGFAFFDKLSADVANYFMVGDVVRGVCFFALLGFSNLLFGIPFSVYSIFVIEEKHGFNRQNAKGFIVDQVKSVLLGVVLGGLLIAGLLWIMQKAGSSWWILAWALVSGFSILVAWIFPTILAPIFNKFSPLPDGDLKQGIDQLAQAVDFPASEVSVMDASKRSSHGNAYFTGVFGKKKIVLFDTLVSALKPSQVIAVLAHELGHFKLKHIRWALIRNVFMTGLVFYLISRGMMIEGFYKAFGFETISTHAALVVFSLWFGLVSFYFQPLQSWLSRKNEFAADNFAKKYASSEDLVTALLSLRETSHSMPISHPWYSAVYHSHPPLLERIKSLRKK